MTENTLLSGAFAKQMRSESLRVKEAAERTAKAAETQDYGRHPNANQLIDLIRK